LTRLSATLIIVQTGLSHRAERSCPHPLATVPPEPAKRRQGPVQPISRHALIPPHLLDSVTRRFGEPTVAALPPVTPCDDPTDAFADLHTRVREADIVLFPDIWPGDLDDFFRLRLIQVLAGQSKLPGLSVVILSAVMAGQTLAAGFADRFRSAWPFARCVFLTEGGDHPALSALIGLPVGPLDDPSTQAPPIVEPNAGTGQGIAVQIQPIWGSCGGTILFENQLESLVRAGFLTIRVFTDGQVRRGATLWARLDHIIPENSTRAGAHIDVVAVPDGPPSRPEAVNIDGAWRDILTTTASVRIRDRAVVGAAARAECTIANRLESLGPALMVSPGARLLLALQEDRSDAVHQTAISNGRSEAMAKVFGNAAAIVQAHMLAMADICAFASLAEMTRLAPQCRRAVAIQPHLTAEMVPESAVPQFDLLLTASEEAMNVASLRWFLDQVWRPHLEARGISVAIAGRAGVYVRDTAHGSPLVHILGFVGELDTIRSWCRLTVVPDLGRAGISAKMLTTLAAGHPVATTRAGLRGLDPSVAGILPAHDDPGALAADIVDLIGSPERLAERRRLVRQVRDAAPPATDYTGLMMTLPRPSGPDIRKRLEHWSRLAGPKPPDAAPYRFQFEMAYPLSGGPRHAQVLLDGWHDAEPWGRWTDGADASLRITLTEPAAEPLTLELVIVPADTGANLRIGWDGTMLPLIDPVPGANSWDIPPALSTGKSSFVVSLHVGETLRPNTAGDSVDDRILGIGVSSVRVLSRQPTLLEPDVAMPVRAGSMPQQVLLTGWHAPEAWGCWSQRTTAVLRLTLREPAQTSIRLELDLETSPANPLLTLSVNGSALPGIKVVAGRNTWDLPPRATNGKTELQVLLSVPETFCAMRAGTGADDRELGIGLRGIRLIPFVPVFQEPGTVLRLVRPDALDEILRAGWHQPEDWGCWTGGPDAVLRLAFREPLAGPFRLEMNLAPGPVNATLTLSVNGHALPAIVPRNGVNSWSLPERLTGGQRDLAIGLHVSGTFTPADIQASTDNRVLGVGVRSLVLQREAAACPIGALVRISSDLGDRGMLADGWHKPEPWGCWSSGPDAAVLLRFAAPLDGPYAIEFDMMAPLLNGPVILSVNGEVLNPLTVSDGPNEWVLPRRRTDGQTVLAVHLMVALPVRPMDVLDSKDDRILGVGIRSLRIRPLRLE
jgi:hypothetical protein